MLRETVKELRKNYPYYCPHCRENIKFETLKRLNENNISKGGKIMNKWILIEVEHQNITEPDTYGSYIEAFDEMKRRYENLVEEGDEASIREFDANIQTNPYNVDWKIYEVECD